jgi:hypothetical protein
MSSMAVAAADGSLDAAYRRCVESRTPLYDYARFTQANGQPALFERLLLPLSADGSRSVTHLAGVAFITELRGDVAPGAITPA